MLHLKRLWYIVKFKMYHIESVWKFFTLTLNTHFFDDIEHAYDIIMADIDMEHWYTITDDFVIRILTGEYTSENQRVA